MSNRCVIFLILSIVLFAGCAGHFQADQSVTSNVNIPVPTKVQYDWHEQERIMFVCLDPCTWQGREYDNHTTDLADMKLPKLDTDQWCQAAMAWGAKEILFVAKHTGGFCWWQTDTSDYSVKNIAWKDGKGCVLDEIARSCGKYGLSMGIYVYPGDDTWGAGIGSGGKTKDPSKQEAYNKVFRDQLRETIRIAKKHTKVSEVWFDGSCIIDVGDILKEEAAEAVILQGTYATIRWVGNEAGGMLYDQSWCTVNKEDLATGVSTSFHSTPDGDAWAPCELDSTLNHKWFWSKPNEANRKSLEEVIRFYYESAGQGAVMLLNSTPNTDGLIPDGDMKFYKALGDEIKRRFDKPLAQTKGNGNQLVLNLGKPQNVNHVIVMEDYRKGERIRKYTVEGWDGNQWKVLTSGSHVGRKHINFFDDAVVSKLRLKVTESVAKPLIRSFQAYDVKMDKKPVLSSYRPWKAKPEHLLQIEESRKINWAICGKWSEADYKKNQVKMQIDLTGKITEAGQWQVKFQPDDPELKLEFADAVLYQQGQASVPGILTQSKDDPMTWYINRTAVVTEGSEDIKLHITIKGPKSTGSVVVKRR